MKKNGFTLAEVLITLTIIGVVATLTLPALMSNTAEQQAATAYRKIMNTLNEAGQMNAAINGFDYSSITDKSAATDTTETAQSLAALFNSRLQVDPGASARKDIPGQCDNLMQTVLRDGTAVCYDGNTVTTGNNKYINVWVDTNGVKGPNMVSTCKESGCTTKAEKNLYDQYPAVLYGGIAAPEIWSSNQTISTAADAQKQMFAAAYAMGLSGKTGRKQQQ